MLGIKYDIKKTLSENKPKKNNEPQVKTVDIFGEPLSFYGKVIKVLAQEIANTSYSSDNNLSKEIITSCYSSIGGKRNASINFEMRLQNCFSNTLSVIKTFNKDAPYAILKDGHEYTLFFTCGEYGNNKDQNMQYDFYPMQCDKDNIQSVGYWSNVKNDWLPVIDLKKQKEYNKKIQQKKDKDLLQNLKTVDIIGNKSNHLSTKQDGVFKDDDSNIINNKNNGKDNKNDIKDFKDGQTPNGKEFKDVKNKNSFNYSENNPNDEEYISVNEIPGLKTAKFNGDFNEWFSDNFIYPKDAKKNNIEGKVNITFTINSDGSTSNFTINSSDNKILSDYTLKLFKSMPNWSPSEKDGNKITSKVTIPVEFILE